MKKVLILYFSGAGATKKIARLMFAHLKEKYTVELRSFEAAGKLHLNEYDAFIIGTPVYHAAPSYVVLDFIKTMLPMKRAAPAFLYNTRATWSCNTNRILAKKLLEKNVITIMDRDYRSPDSDGSLIVPFVRRFFQFERQIREKVARDCDIFLSRLDTPGIKKGYIPHFRVSSIINAPNKLAGQLITFPILLHRDHCTRCGRCIRSCPHHAWKRDTQGYPVFQRKKCENCYRCIHHCPAKALSLSKRRRPKKLLYSKQR